MVAGHRAVAASYADHMRVVYVAWTTAVLHQQHQRLLLAAVLLSSTASSSAPSSSRGSPSTVLFVTDNFCPTYGSANHLNNNNSIACGCLSAPRRCSGSVLALWYAALVMPVLWRWRRGACDLVSVMSQQHGVPLSALRVSNMPALLAARSLQRTPGATSSDLAAE
jgi:hypothetical protein